MKMADLVGTDYRLLTVIYRLGMKLGFGEKTVEETCRESGVNCDTFLLIANVYATDGYVPTLELMTAASAIDLVRYLHASHSYYLEHEFKDLDVLFKDLLGPCTPMQREVIMHFFDGYREEVENPFCIRRGYGVPLCEIRGRRAEGGRIQYRDIRREPQQHRRETQRLEKYSHEISATGMRHCPRHTCPFETLCAGIRPGKAYPYRERCPYSHGKQNGREMSVAKKKVLVITPSRIIARGLSSILEEHGGFTVTAVLSDLSRENEPAVTDSRADIVIADPVIFGYSSRPAGRNRISDLTDAAVVAAPTALPDDESVKNYDGIIGIYDTPATVVSKLRSALSRTAGKDHDDSREELSSREKEILVCVARGMLNKEIADRFHISIHTVITHRKNITRKTGIKTVAGLTVYALLNNLIDPSIAN